MPKGKHIEATYLKALKEARQGGADDQEAAKIAEEITLKEHGKLPPEGQRK